MPDQSMVTLVNHFTLNEGTDPSKFEDEFARIGEYFAQQDGILGYTLSRDIKEPSEYVNVALWTDTKSLHAAISTDGFTQLVSHLRTLATSVGHTFEQRLQYVSESIHAY